MKRFFSLLTSSTLLLNTFSASYAQDATITPITKSSPEKLFEKTPVVTPKAEVVKTAEKPVVASEKPVVAPLVKPVILPVAVPAKVEAPKVVEKPVTTPIVTPLITKPVTIPKTEAFKPVVPTEKAPTKVEAPKVVEKPVISPVAVPTKVETPKVVERPVISPVAVPTKVETPKVVEKPVILPVAVPAKVETPVVTPKVVEKAVASSEKPALKPVIAPKVEVSSEKYSTTHKLSEENKDYRKVLHSKNADREYGKTMEHSEVDSDLILSRYDNKQFIKTKIEEVAKTIVQKDIEIKKTIADQMGAIGSKKISVSIDETVSIKDAIMEVSNLAGIDIEIDPSVEGSIILAVKNTKVADVLERIAELAQLNISVRDNVVRFTANKPFTKNYNISFLDSMNAANNNASSASSVAVGNQNNNINPYNSQSFNGSSNGGNVSGGVAMNSGANGGLGNPNQINSNALYNTTSAVNNPSMWIEFENGLKYIVSQRKDTLYSVNKQAGIVTLRAPLIIHKEVEEYIERVKKVATTQILVEVRLVEVQLNDEFSTGINFSTTGSTAASGAFGAYSTVNALSSTPFALNLTAGALTAAVQFLQSFGTTKAIASPRLNVMNNQKSKLSFAKDQVYFSLQPQIQNSYTTLSGTTSTASNPIIVQSTIHTIPVGIILELQATADIEKNEITMNIHPVLSSIIATVADPAATFLSSLNNVNSAASAITNSIPIVEKKELNSTLRIKSGEIMVVGGFNEEKTLVERVGIPYLKDIPYLKILFGRNTKSVHNVETVIFIKATIMTPENSLGDDDTKFYNDFA